jgi:glyoxylase-like metal-dependent hydrolase (beta-lactamase superfamily II)
MLARHSTAPREGALSDTYEIFAIRYGTKADRHRRETFIIPPGNDPHDAPAPIDYFVWLIRNQDRTFVVDTGFDRAEGEKRGRKIDRLPREGLAMLGVDAAAVKDVVVTHLHYDHAGTLGDFPAATFHIQDREVQYATGRHMCHDCFGYAYTAEHVCQLVRKVYEKKVAFHDGDEEIAPGVSLHLIGGHTMGVQCVRVNTKRGPVVLASDATHFYENMEKVAPFPIVFSVADMVEGYAKMRKLAGGRRHSIVPGHDPLVLKYYPAPNKELEGVVARLDVEPKV